VERRNFLKWTGIGLLASYFPLALAACSNKSDRNAVAEGAGKFTTIGTTAQLKANGYLLNKKSKVLVVQQDNQLIALNSACTHRGCTVKLDKSDNTLVCPCHDAKFGLGGEVLAKPAKTPLPTYQVKAENGEILVKIT
jgi:cytochrome b6-f complex iron-sulfur subunit